MQIEETIALIEAIWDDPAMVTRVEQGGALRIVWANAALCTATGYTADELVGQDPGIFAGPMPDNDAVSWLSDARAAQKRFRGTLPYSRKDGSHFWGELQLSPWFDAAGECAFWVSLVRDTTQDMELREAFQEAKQAAVTAQERLWSAIEALPHGFVLFDSEDRMVICNTPYRTAYRVSDEAIEVGKTFEEMLRTGLERGQFPSAAGREDEWLADRLAHHRNPNGPIEQELPENEFVRIHEVRTPTGDTVGFRIDVTELKRQQQAIERHARALSIAMERAEVSARTDALTGLANRRGLDMHLRSLSGQDGGDADGLARPAGRAGGTMAAFLHIDLDRFKQINDMHGHAAGDRVLREVAAILRRSVRPGDHVARVGGDEFAIVIETDDAETTAREVADRVIAACRQPVWFEGRPCHFGVSVGIALAGPGEPRANLMEDADIALYEAKERGRNQMALFTPALRETAEEGNRLADDLRLAFDNAEFEPWFEPQTRIDTHEIVGIEVQTRWRHPVRGIILPATYLPVAEELGLAEEIDLLVFRRALDAMAQLDARGLGVARMSFNIGCHRLLRAGLDGVLQEAGALPCRVAVELSDASHDLSRTPWLTHRLAALRAAGAEIVIDGFGSSEASLATLMQMRPDRVKLSSSLVAMASKTSVNGPTRIAGHDLRALRSIGDMIGALGICMTATGVDTQATADFMREIGCDTLQGTLLAPPMPVADFAEWHAERSGNAGPALVSVGSAP